eukprot:gene14478-16027_t
MKEIELLLRECYPRLLIHTFVHPPYGNSSGEDLLQELLGFISIHKVRLLLRPCDIYADLNSNSLSSEDGNFNMILIPHELKESSYWSVWREKMSVCIDESLPASEPHLQKKVIPIVMDPDLWEVIRQKKTFGGVIGYKLEGFLYFNMSTIFDTSPSIPLHGKETLEELFDRISNTIGLPLKPSTIEAKNKKASCIMI